MRILHCIANMVGGGAERQCAILSAAQIRRGHEVHVALISGGPNLSWLEQGGAELHWVRAANYYDPRIVLQLMGIIQRVLPDVVQSWLVNMDVAAGLAARRLDIPWVLCERASRPQYPPSPKTWLRRWLGRGASAIVANSNAGAAYWRDTVRSRMVVVIPNAVPFEAIAAANGRPALNHRLILSAGRLTAQKNLPTLIEALSMVLHQLDAQAMICGDGPQEGELRRLVDALGTAGLVEITGYRNDLWAVMKRAAVFVSVAHFEGHPNTVLEAMACRLPVVVSDIPEHREFLDDSVAWFADPHRPEEIARAIQNVLENPSLGAQKAEAAFERVRQFTPDTTAARYDSLYKACCAK